MTSSPETAPLLRPPLRMVVHWLATPFTAVVVALILLGAGLAFAFQIERIGRAEKVQQIAVQAHTLASGIAAPLAFDDEAAVREYLNALRADPQIVAAAAYGSDGHLVTGYALPPERLAERGQAMAPRIAGNALIVTAPVMQGNMRLGSVYLHSNLDSWSRRATRYIGIAVIVIMASLLIAVLGASYASLREAHRKLQTETASREHAEEALRQSQKMEALGQLTGGVAHDFNNLLMVASGGLELLERTKDPAKIEKLKTGIRQALDRGAKLTQQLLTFSRRSALKPEIIDLRERVRGLDALLERSLGEGIQLAMDLPDEPCPVEVDASELEVAILNIVLNARDAMPGGGTISIRVDSLGGPGHGKIRMAISDTGSGIAPEVVGKIFEPFYTTKAVGQGTGLGLSQVYGFVQASGGEFNVQSEVGKGTTIALLLPRSSQIPKGGNAPADAITASSKERILLVEDDNTVAEMVDGMLNELGYEAERAINADAALKRLETGADFSMLLSDMVMPGAINGLDLVRQVRERWPAMRTMLMTGYSASASSAAKEGVRLLPKPFSIQELSIEIEATLKPAGSRQVREG